VNPGNPGRIQRWTGAQDFRDPGPSKALRPDFICEGASHGAAGLHS
jgi:hypothetical protein